MASGTLRPKVIVTKQTGVSRQAKIVWHQFARLVQISGCEAIFEQYSRLGRSIMSRITERDFEQFSCHLELHMENVFVSFH